MERKQYRTIDEYIAAQPEVTGKILGKLRDLIKQTVPNSQGTISYGIPTFRLNGKNLVHFAAYRHHVGFYPTPSGISAFPGELAPFTVSKGAVRFPLDRPVPYELIEKIVRFRMDEVLHKKTAPGESNR